MGKDEPYIPALGHAWLTPLYDPLLRLGMREERFKRALLAQARIEPGQRVLDLGCGTGTLAVLIKQTHPGADVVGLDADPQVLAIARLKSEKAGVALRLDHGLAYQLPYPDRTFNRVLSSLVMHHLTREEKQRAFREAQRVLRPGGELHIADFGKPHTLPARLIALATRRLERAADNVDGLLPRLIQRAGFVDVSEPTRYMTLFGTLSLYCARKSG